MQLARGAEYNPDTQRRMVYDDRFDLTKSTTMLTLQKANSPLGLTTKETLTFTGSPIDDLFLIHMDLTGQTHEQTCKTQKTRKGENAQTTTTCTDTLKKEFAPFSHDADAPVHTPEPASLLLMGLEFRL